MVGSGVGVETEEFKMVEYMQWTMSIRCFESKKMSVKCQAIEITTMFSDKSKFSFPG